MAHAPLILSFDTSAAHCAAALLSGDRILATRGEEMGRGQAERLFPMLEDLLGEANVTWRDLTAIGVGVGPGNFTGIRIAVSAARGLALGLSIPAVGVSSFDALREGAEGPVLAAVSAPRGAVYLDAPDASPLGPVQPDALAAEIPVVFSLLLFLYKRHTIWQPGCISPYSHTPAATAAARPWITSASAVSLEK